VHPCVSREAQETADKAHEVSHAIWVRTFTLPVPRGPIDLAECDDIALVHRVLLCKVGGKERECLLQVVFNSFCGDITCRIGHMLVDALTLARHIEKFLSGLGLGFDEEVVSQANHDEGL